jgi:hypothetical protein|tara:strand:+ start:1441 stop:1626 length:186 start_codon:yes stop_codon:yes gene_type:complete
MSELTKTQDSVLNGLVRHILTAGGGYLVAKGMIDEGSVETVVGAVIALAGVVWSAVAKKKD